LQVTFASISCLRAFFGADLTTTHSTPIAVTSWPVTGSGTPRWQTIVNGTSAPCGIRM